MAVLPAIALLVHATDAAAGWWVASETQVAVPLFNFGVSTVYPAGAILSVTTNDSSSVAVSSVNGTTATVVVRAPPGQTLRVVEISAVLTLQNNFSVSGMALVEVTKSLGLTTTASPYPRFVGSDAMPRTAIHPIAGTLNTTAIGLESVLQLADGGSRTRRTAGSSLQRVYAGPLAINYTGTNRMAFSDPEEAEDGIWVFRAVPTASAAMLINASSTFASAFVLSNYTVVDNPGVVVVYNSTMLTVHQFSNFSVSPQLDLITLACRLSDGSVIDPLFAGTELLYPGLVKLQIEADDASSNISSTLALLGLHSFAPQMLTVKAAANSTTTAEFNLTVNFETVVGGVDVGQRVGLAIPPVIREGTVFEVPVWAHFGGATPGAVQMAILYDASVLQPFGVVNGSAGNWTDNIMSTVNNPSGRIRLGGLARVANIRVHHE